MTFPAATATGWFIHAEAYVQAAMTLHHAGRHDGRAENPIRFLYYHAIELTLKSYLIHSGLTAEDLKKRGMGHQVITLGEKCVEYGLLLSDADLAALSFIEPDVFLSRYVKPSIRTVVTLPELEAFALRLSESVKAKLQNAGLPVR